MLSMCPDRKTNNERDEEVRLPLNEQVEIRHDQSTYARDQFIDSSAIPTKPVENKTR